MSDKIKTVIDHSDEKVVNSNWNNSKSADYLTGAPVGGKPTDGNNQGGQTTAQNASSEGDINKTWNKGAIGKKDFDES